MKDLYLPYREDHDSESGLCCLTGYDTLGKEFGVGVAEELSMAQMHLRDWILDVLIASADESEGRFSDLLNERPANRECLVFTPEDLIPVRLRLLRNQKGLSQQAVAARLGVTQQAYAKFERPGANLSLKTLVRVEQALEGPVLTYA